MTVHRRNLHSIRSSIAAIALCCAGAMATPPGPTLKADAPPTPQREPVVGVATIRGKAHTATIRWSYRKDGKLIESAVPPRTMVTRLSSSAALMMIKLPGQLFAIRIGEDLERTLDEPVLLDGKGEATCSCRMREDCGRSDEALFHCEVQGWLKD